MKKTALKMGVAGAGAFTVFASRTGARDNGNMEDQTGRVRSAGLCKELESGMGEKEALAWVAKGLDIHGADAYGMTPLMWACHMGMEGLAKAVIATGANPMVVDVDGMGAELFAASSGFAGCVGAVLDAMPAFDYGSKRAVEALLAAASEGHVESSLMLIKRGVEIDARGVLGMTPLLCACRSGRVEVARELLAAGADVNATRDDGLGAGHLVAINGQLDVVENLTGHGLDWLAVAQGKAALELARERGHDDVAQAIGKAMAMVERRACDEAAKRMDGQRMGMSPRI